MIQGTNCSLKLGRPSLKESRTSDELDLSIKIILPKAKKDCAGKVHILLLELKGDSQKLVKSFYVDLEGQTSKA